MERPQNNANYRAIGLQSTGFSLLKATCSGNFLIQNHKNASFTTLLRECGIFFGEEQGPVRVVVNTSPLFLVPKELFTPPASQFLKIQTDISENEAVMEDEIGDYKALYTFNSGKIAQLQQAGLTPCFQHTSTILARYLQLNDGGSPHRMLLFFHGNAAECVLFCYNQLSYVGVINFATSDEVVYSIANILRQHEVEANECLLLFSGEMPESTKTFDSVNQYFPLMDWAGDLLPASIQSSADKSVDAHTILNLLPF